MVRTYSDVGANGSLYFDEGLWVTQVCGGAAVMLDLSLQSIESSNNNMVAGACTSDGGCFNVRLFGVVRSVYLLTNLLERDLQILIGDPYGISTEIDDL